MTTYGVLGVGSIAAAIVTRLCDGVTNPPDACSPPGTPSARPARGTPPTVRVAADNQEVVDAGDVVIVCLLPVHANDVLPGLGFRPEQAVISAIAGLHLAQLAELVAPATDLARSIPLPAVATRGSVTPVHPATEAAATVFDRLGGTMEIADEVAYESVAAASATVAAYFRYLATIADWLSGHGIPTAEAQRYVAATFAALSTELDSPEVDFVALTRAHMTPGGLNEQFARDVGAAGTYDAVRVGLDAVLARISPG